MTPHDALFETACTGNMTISAQFSASNAPASSDAYPYRWRVRARLPHRYMQRCRVVTWARRMNSCLVEFVDGVRVVTSKNYIRKVTGGDQ